MSPLLDVEQRPPLVSAERDRPRLASTRPRGGRSRRSRRRRVRTPDRSRPQGPPILARPRGVTQASGPRLRRRRLKRLAGPWTWPKGFWAWLWLGVLLVLTTLALAHPGAQVQRVEVIGLQWLPAEALTAVPALQGWRGRPLVAIDADQVAAAVQAAYPALGEVKVQVRWPGRLVIVAHERPPVLVWQVGSQTWWVSAQGVAFAPPTEAQPDPSWPVVQVQVTPGMEPPTAPTASEVALALALARQMGPETALVYHPVYGMGWRAPQGWLVFVGHTFQGLEARLAVYDALVAALEARGLYPTRIDLSAWQSPTLSFASDDASAGR